jgi:uncharacterized membrane protein
VDSKQRSCHPDDSECIEEWQIMMFNFYIAGVIVACLILLPIFVMIVYGKFVRRASNVSLRRYPYVLE